MNAYQPAADVDGITLAQRHVLAALTDQPLTPAQIKRRLMTGHVPVGVIRSLLVELRDMGLARTGISATTPNTTLIKIPRPGKSAGKVSTSTIDSDPRSPPYPSALRHLASGAMLASMADQGAAPCRSAPSSSPPRSF